MLTGILVSLEHHLCISSDGIPELNTPVLGTAHNPVSIGSETHAQNKVLSSKISIDRANLLRRQAASYWIYLVALKCAHTFTTLHGICVAGPRDA